MRAFLSHETALAYWREHFPLDSEPGRPARISVAQEYAHTREDVVDCVPEWYAIPGKPIDILVFDQSLRRQSKGIAAHLWSSKAPLGSFYRDGHVYVCSPELVFLQMAPKLTIVQLIALGCELCGTYILIPKGRTHPGAIDEYPTRNAPLTNTQKLFDYLSRAEGARGRTKALRAARYVVDGSRSPMETMTYMSLCLPPMLGGYGLPKPTMNAWISLDDEGASIAHRWHCEGDLCWPEEKLDVEYHGEVHVGAGKMKDDVGRILGIEHMKYRVITVTSSQVFDITQFEVVANEVAAHLGRRLHPRILGYTQARQALHDELSQWMFA